MRLTKDDYIDDIKLELFGGILNPEIDNNTIAKIIDKSMIELNKYYNATEIAEIPCSSCIDLTAYPNIDTVTNIYRPETLGASSSTAGNNSSTSTALFGYPIYNYGGSYNFPGNYTYNTIITTLTQRLASVTSTDLAFQQDKRNGKLYINFTQSTPTTITLEYVPRLTDVSQIKNDFWEDMLFRLSLAHTKVILGRIRTRFTQNGALWAGDGERILSEGQEELKALREQMYNRLDTVYPID